MTLKKMTLVIVTLAIVLSCSPSKNELQELETEVANAALVNAEGSAVDNSCFDKKMEMWFTAFNYFQAQGHDMEDADKLATEAVEKEFSDCNAIAYKNIASNPESDIN